MPITRKKSSSKKSSARTLSRAGSSRDDDLDRYPSRQSDQARRSSSRRSYEPDRSYSPRQSYPSRRSYKPRRYSILGNLSPERKMDLVGVIMAIIGLLTVISIPSAGHGGLAGFWFDNLRTVFGLGVYILPVGLIVLGVWLVARNVDRLPALNLERVVGIIMLFIGLLVAFQAGNGGGSIGKLLAQALVSSIDVLGTVIVVIAWLIVALAMTMDLTNAGDVRLGGAAVQKAQRQTQPADP